MGPVVGSIAPPPLTHQLLVGLISGTVVAGGIEGCVTFYERVLPTRDDEDDGGR
jgi:hypothetical protein